jgi:two-component system, OmpR family, alkaline phosphatase synthesis response regulator PhoP
MKTKNPQNILIVEDDEDIQELIRYNLDREGFSVKAVDSGEKALDHIEKRPVDLVVLDLMLPAIDGLEVCRRIRTNAASAKIPVLIVTAKAEETEVIVGLELGADDYLCKPFKVGELVARVKALLRRSSSRKTEPESEEILERGPLYLHTGRREALLRGKPLDLTYTEFEVLRLLASRPGWVFSRYQIVDAIRGNDYPVTDRSVDVQLVGLRRKLEKDAVLLETVRGVGYRFQDRSG